MRVNVSGRWVWKADVGRQGSGLRVCERYRDVTTRPNLDEGRLQRQIGSLKFFEVATRCSSTSSTGSGANNRPELALRDAA